MRAKKIMDWSDEVRVYRPFRAGDPPSVEVCEEVEDAGPEGLWLVFRFDIPRLSPEQVAGEWFHKHLPGIAKSIGSDPETIIRDFGSRRTGYRVWAYLAVAHTQGLENFDYHPLRLTTAEVEKRYKIRL